MSNLYGVVVCAQQVVENSEIVFLAVKPQFVQPVLKEVREHLTERHTVVSIAAGKTLSSLIVRPTLGYNFACYT